MEYFKPSHSCGHSVVGRISRLTDNYLRAFSAAATHKTAQLQVQHSCETRKHVHKHVCVISKARHSKIISGNAAWQQRSSEKRLCRQERQWTLIYLLIGIRTMFWLRQPGVKSWHISFHSTFSPLFLNDSLGQNSEMVNWQLWYRKGAARLH